MRVISGSARGRKLKGPPSNATRTDGGQDQGRAVQHPVLPRGRTNTPALDLYAGTGNIGIEALSRGASHADFVDQGREQCAVIRDNLETTGFAPLCKVHQTSVRSNIESRRGSYDFVIVDLRMRTMTSSRHSNSSGRHDGIIRHNCCAWPLAPPSSSRIRSVASNACATDAMAIVAFRSTR